MRRESISEVIGNIDGAFVEEALELTLPVGDGDPEKENDMNGTTGRSARKMSRTLLIAAVAAALLALSVLAVMLYSASDRRVEQGETFSINWDSPGGQLELKNATYAMEFEGPEECPEMEFRPGWLPVDKDSGFNSEINAWAEHDGWYKRLTCEGTEPSERPETYRDVGQPCLIELWYAPQFRDGGALVLLDYEPEEVHREQWGEREMTYFHAQFSYTAGNGMEYTMEQNYVIQFSPADGWIIVCSQQGGEDTMPDLLRVAKELELRPTGNTIRSTDFADNNVVMNGGVG